MIDDNTVIGYHSTGDPCGKGIRISDLDEKWRKRIEDYPAIMERSMERINYIAELEDELAQVKAAFDATQEAYEGRR